jgi:hypothetical protein
MKIILVEFDSGDGVEAEAFKTKESLINWYKELETDEQDLKDFKSQIEIENSRFTVGGYHTFTIFYTYGVM